MSIEAMKQWLAALEHSHANEPIWKTPHKDAITSLRQAIEHAEKQKPVKVGRITDNIKGMVMRQEVMLYTDDYLPIGTALYTTPQPQEKNA